ncbi:unnamed protein product [Schistosoma rodhaini]|uniref:EF-hand domain-containing protein n=1 Tax=Schistosoma rodhaini TaxID=6188 RepID=A0A183RN72_9TREM|nr:unnamed protein product [Schistosoma rodhaini]CAH8682259.1 unnamed protein product [Schistosoma rodhaini]
MEAFHVDYNRKLNSDQFWWYIFAQVDINHNGKIDKNEFKKYMDKYSSKLGSKDVEKAFKYCDLDNNGTIEFEEFKKYMLCE